MHLKIKQSLILLSVFAPCLSGLAQEEKKQLDIERAIWMNSPPVLAQPRSVSELQENPDYQPSLKPNKSDTTYFQNQPIPPVNLQGARSAVERLAYPMIFVHGLNGTSSSWSDFVNWIDPAVKVGANLNFCLNDDVNSSTSNVLTDLESFIPDDLAGADVYKINFNCYSYGTCSSAAYGNMSNQAAVFKQGRAVGLAIDAVLTATGKEKVILVGHSCGGLAIREYYQNEDHWVGDSHRVAKIVTVGTPNMGSNFGVSILNGFFSNIPDTRSEAVRDLRNSYYYSGNEGVYLFGGLESLSYMDDMLFDYFYNSDVNCNGTAGNTVTGLNQRSIDSSIDFSSVYDTSDLIVGNNNINYYYPSDSWGGENLCTFLDAAYLGSFPQCESFATNPGGVDGGHMALISEITEIIAAIDEADDYDRAYIINPGNTYAGFFTPQSPVGPYSTDWDDFVVSVPADGTLGITWELTEESIGAVMYVYDVWTQTYIASINGYSVEEYLEVEVTAGDYIIEFNKAQSSGFSQYWFTPEIIENECPSGEIYCAEGTTWIAELQLCVPNGNNCPADLNEDQIVSVSDLLLLLTEFGASCPE